MPEIAKSMREAMLLQRQMPRDMILNDSYVHWRNRHRANQRSGEISNTTYRAM